MPVPPPPLDPIPTEAVPEPLAAPEARRVAAATPGVGLAESAPAGAAAAAALPGLADLTHAFQANAQALEGVGALQLKLIEALQRGDRSELVLANVQGLNEAFRGLTAIQKSLLDRVEGLHAPQPAARGSRAVPLLLLGVGALLVLCTWALVGAIEDHGRMQPDPRLLTEHAADLLQSGREEAARVARQDAERLTAQIRDSETRVAALQERLDQEREGAAQRQRELSSKEAEVEALKRQTAAAQNEALKMSSLENEIKLLTQDAALVEPRMRGLERELEDQRRDNLMLRKRLGSLEMGYEEPATPPPASIVGPGPGPAPMPERITSLVGPGAARGAQPPTPGPDGPPPAPPPAALASLVPPPPYAPSDVEPPSAPGAASGGEEARPTVTGVTQRPGDVPVTRDPAAVEQVRTTLNRLLDGARARRPDSWTLARVDGVAPDRLRGVLAQRLDPSGLVLETVEAREAFFWVDRASRRVKLELVEGVRTVGTQRGEALQGRMEAVIAEGDAATVFARSGLQVVRER